MPAITFSDFSGGLDRRLPVTVQDASRLWILRNAFISTGKRIEKRPGLKKIADSLGGTVGLASLNGRLKTFASVGDVTTPTAQVDILLLDIPSDIPAGKKLERVYAAEVFNGFAYVVAEYDITSAVYIGGISEGNSGGAGADTGGGRVPPPRDPHPGDPGTA